MPRTDGNAAELKAVVHRTFVPNRMLVVLAEGEALDRQAKVIPLLAGKRAPREKPTAYLCRGHYCELPTSDPKVFAAQLAKIEPLFEDRSPAPLPVAKAR